MTTTHTNTDTQYDTYLAKINERFERVTENGHLPLFTTNVDDLFLTYLDGFETPELRQHHTCNTCKKFLRNFGSLVVIDDNGDKLSPIWDEADAPEEHKPTVAKMLKAISKAKVTGVFITKEETLGHPESGGWHHLSVSVPQEGRARHYKPPHEIAAQHKQNYITLQRALKEYPLALINRAVIILTTDSLYRCEKVVPIATWLQALAQSLEGVKGARRSHIVWKAVAKAPDGFCTPRTGMIGTLLDDLKEGLSDQAVAKRFASKMSPLLYQRPSALPKAGAVAAAEKAFQELGLAKSLERRFARLEEIQAVWRHTEDKKEEGSIFGHLLTPKREEGSTFTPVPITWVKWAKTVLPNATSIKLKIPPSGPFAAMTTATHIDAPPIIQWDREESRNPFSWYTYIRGSLPEEFGLKAGTWVKVNAISLHPAHWQEGFNHFEQNATFILDSARDRRKPGLDLFPEILKSHLHPFRSTIEAHCSHAHITGEEEATAVGIFLRNSIVATTIGTTTVCHKIERWD